MTIVELCEKHDEIRKKCRDPQMDDGAFRELAKVAQALNASVEQALSDSQDPSKKLKHGQILAQLTYFSAWCHLRMDVVGRANA